MKLYCKARCYVRSSSKDNNIVVWFLAGKVRIYQDVIKSHNQIKTTKPCHKCRRTPFLNTMFCLLLSQSRPAVLSRGLTRYILTRVIRRVLLIDAELLTVSEHLILSLFSNGLCGVHVCQLPALMFLYILFKCLLELILQKSKLLLALPFYILF